MSIFTQTLGQGDDVVLIHGWGMGGNVWESVAEKLSQHFRVTILDLPGYGRSAQHPLSDYSLPGIADALAQIIPANSTVVGWSLGGMIAMQLALNHADVLRRLVIVASSPQFQISKDWPHAVDTKVLETFASELASSYKDTIQQFLAIQAIGSEHAREEIRLLRSKVFRDGEPDPYALRKSLNILQTASLRDEVTQIKTETLIISGERDRLVPIAAAEILSQSIEGSQLRIVKGASHAPFISHQEEFLQILRTFLS